jgi:site-specific recombinase XerC
LREFCGRLNTAKGLSDKRWRWHDVRAAYITHVAMTSGPLAAQKLARHSDFSTTQAYIEVADEVMRGAADRASQRPALALIAGKKS